MITIDINPTMVQIGPFVLTWHGFFSAVGLAVALWLVGRESRRFGVTEEQTSFVALWGIIAAIIGARLFHVIDSWDYYSQQPLAILLINQGGIAIYGAIVGGVAGGAAAAWWRGWPLGPFADLGGIGLIVGQAIGRLGDVINGEHHGKPYAGSLSVVYTNSNTLGQPGVPVHLAVGYELVWDVAVLTLLAFVRLKRPPSGLVFWVYLGLYSLGRFFISFLRYDTIGALGLSQAQVVALALAALSAFAVLYLWLRPRRVMVPE